MKTQVIFLVFSLLLGLATISNAQQEGCDDAREAVKNIKAAVEREDVQQIVSYIGNGLWVGDVSYGRKKVLALLNNKKSWLYQGFFGKRDSMKQYLARGSIEIKIQKEGDSRLVELISKKSEAMPSSFNLMCIEGKWRLTDIYSF